MAELSCSAVGKWFGDREVLRDVGLDVPAGTLTAILGASGSGKTTLLRLIVGFIGLEAGTISVGGEVVAAAGVKPLAPDKRGVGYVAQEGALFPHLRVGENVGFGLSRAERKGAARTVEVLELVGLGEDYLARHPHELSGGEQRRVALARALAPRPALVLLDEPFSGLDASLRVETREAVLQALKDEGSTALMVTHDQAEALSMGREVAVLQSGRLVQTAAPEVVYRSPADLEVARFVGQAVVLDGQAARGVVTCALGRLEVHGGVSTGPVRVMVRPEQIRLGRRSGNGDSGVSARVLSHSSFGPDTVVKLALGSAQTGIEARTFDHAVPAAGELVDVAVAGPVFTYPADSGSASALSPSAA
ncbi:MAG TPA: ABC transporter ATP-binding protein [Solirubrobacteraceae bacterium]